MNWSVLCLLKNKFILSALIAINLLPFLANIMELTGFDTWKMKLAIIGSIVFIVYYLTVESMCPEVIKRSKNKNQYTQTCLETNVNPYTEFCVIKLADEKYIIDGLEGKIHLYPPEEGIYFSRNDTIKQYSELNYRFLNESKQYFRYLLTLIFFISFLATNTPLFIRVINSLR